MTTSVGMRYPRSVTMTTSNEVSQVSLVSHCTHCYFIACTIEIMGGAGRRGVSVLVRAYLIVVVMGDWLHQSCTKSTWYAIAIATSTGSHCNEQVRLLRRQFMVTSIVQLL